MRGGCGSSNVSYPSSAEPLAPRVSRPRSVSPGMLASRRIRHPSGGAASLRAMARRHASPTRLAAAGEGRACIIRIETDRKRPTLWTSTKNGELWAETLQDACAASQGFNSETLLTARSSECRTGRAAADGAARAGLAQDVGGRQPRRADVDEIARDRHRGHARVRQVVGDHGDDELVVGVEARRLPHGIAGERAVRVL